MSLPEKENIMGLLKRTMEKGELKIPYDSELFNEINREKIRASTVCNPYYARVLLLSATMRQREL